MKKIPNDRHDQETESFIQKLRHVALTKNEAQSMRERLVAYSDLHTVFDTTAKSSSFTSPQISVFFRFVSSYPRVLIAGTLVVLLLISGTGVTYAAQGTLPGQILYPVKVNVIEPIQGALITTTAGQAQWQEDLANRRLTEAATLAAQNKLATSTQEYLAQATAQHIALAQKDATTLADSGNVDAALNVRSNLEAQLSANADFFTLITPRLEAGDDSTTTSAVLALLQGIEQDRTGVEISREQTEAALASTTIGSQIAFNDLDSTSTEAMEAEDASTTPDEEKVIAYVDTENADRQNEEIDLLDKKTALFRLLPGMAIPTSTASSTFWISAASSTDATTSPFRILLARPHKPDDASSSEDVATSTPEALPLPNL